MSKPMFVAVSDFCETGSGTTPSRKKMDEYYGGSIPWVKSGELRESIIHSTEETVSERALKETALKIAPSGALLVAMYGATVGRVGRLGVAAATNQAICHIVPDPKLADEQYLFHALCAKSEELIGRGVGGAQPNISQGTIKNTKIYLPLLPEQRRIAGILDHADALLHLRRQSLSRLSDLKRALFAELAGDLRDNERNWPVYRLGDICRPKQWKTIPSSELTQDGFAVYGANGKIGFYPTYNHEQPTVLITCRGATCGTINVCDAKSYVTGNAMALDDLNQDVVNTEFLAAVLKNTDMNPVISGSAQPQIIGATIRELKLVIPSKSTQKRYLTLETEVKVKARTMQTDLEHLCSLFASLQHRAFRGEL